MNGPEILRSGALALALALLIALARPAPAPALGLLDRVCGVAGFVSGAAGKVCSLAQHGGRLLKAGGELARGHLGAAASAVLGDGGGGAAAGVAAVAGVAALSAAASHGAADALRQTAHMLGATVSPQLQAGWFSSVYWRVAAIATLLTLPFLLAAVVQALLRSDLPMLLRTALGYLPLAMLATAVAAQLTALLLGATDALCGLVSHAAGDAAPAFLQRAAVALTELGVGSASPFIVIAVAAFTVLGAIALWTELLMRDVAVYVIVVMLPLAFAALVWPARRVWAVRAVEVLVALILSKLAMITVLTLGGAALESMTATGMLAGFVLLALAAFAPWALLRLIPLAELASSAAGSLRGQLGGTVWPEGRTAVGIGAIGHEWATGATADMRRDADASDELAGAPRLLAAGRPPEDDRGTFPGRPPVGGPSPGGDSVEAPEDGAEPLPEAAGDLFAGWERDPGPGGATRERLPGMGPMWQVPNFTMSLDLSDHDGPVPPMWRPDGADDAPPAGGGTGGEAPAPARGAATGSAPATRGDGGGDGGSPPPPPIAAEDEPLAGYHIGWFPDDVSGSPPPAEPAPPSAGTPAVEPAEDPSTHGEERP